MYEQKQNTRLGSLVELRKKISIPETDFAEVTDDTLRLTYSICGKEKHLFFSTQAEAAEWLLATGFIVRYFETKGEVIMHEEQLSDVCRDGEHVQTMIEVPMTWNEFADKVDYEDFFTRDLLLHLAASHEYNYVLDPVLCDVSAIPSLLRNYLLTDNRA